MAGEGGVLHWAFRALSPRSPGTPHPTSTPGHKRPCPLPKSSAREGWGQIFRPPSWPHLQDGDVGAVIQEAEDLRAQQTPHLLDVLQQSQLLEGPVYLRETGAKIDRCPWRPLLPPPGTAPLGGLSGLGGLTLAPRD